MKRTIRGAHEGESHASGEHHADGEHHAEKKHAEKKPEEKKKRKPNQGFQNLLDVAKHISQTLNISNGPAAKKLAGQVLRDVQEKHPNIDVMEKGKKAIKHFDENRELYKA